ncbi:MAG: hypothetical protein HYR55_19040 [Acidobacteria bacterium]|nr:hypothetical protein [Acidobacteriota bacterium]MBI3658187.1 hypothetical protein [Acidobacteriota bacterium]
MKRCELYGFAESDLSVLAQRLEHALQVTFQERDSLYRGIYYLWEEDERGLRLQQNLDAEEGVPMEPDYPHLKSLLWLSADQQFEILKSKLIATGLGPVLINANDSM